MKAVVVTNHREGEEQIQLILKENFPFLEMVKFSFNEKVLESLEHLEFLQLIILDITGKTESMDGFFSQLTLVSRNRPILFVNAPSQFSAPQDLYLQNMANEILACPLDVKRFVQIIESSLIWTEEQVFHENTQILDPKDLVAMKIKNFFHWTTIPFDAFLEINSPKFVKIIFSNQPYYQRQLVKYIKRKVKFLYLWKKDYLSFLEGHLSQFNEFLEQTPFSVLPHNKLPTVFEKQIQICSFIHDYLRRVGVTESLLLYMENLVNSIMKVYNGESHFKTLLKLFPMQEDDVAARGVLGAYLCQSLLKKLNWTSDLSRRKMIFISLIHDCMITQESLLKVIYKVDVTLVGLTEIEERAFFHHTLMAAELAKNFNKYPESSFIIAQHHELADGSGFPYGHNSVELIPLSCLFILCSNFTNQIYGTKLTQKDINGVLKVFLSIYKKGEFKQPLWALVSELQEFK